MTYYKQIYSQRNILKVCHLSIKISPEIIIKIDENSINKLETIENKLRDKQGLKILNISAVFIYFLFKKLIYN